MRRKAGQTEKNCTTLRVTDFTIEKEQTEAGANQENRMRGGGGEAGIKAYGMRQV